MTIRVAILGCGKIARLHALGYQSAGPMAKVVVCCDEYDRGLAEQMAAPFQADVLTRWEEVVARTDVDALSICLPSY